MQSRRKVLASKQSDYQGGLREPSAKEIAAKRLSPAAVKKLYKARVDAYNRYMKVLEAVIALEAYMEVEERWSINSREFQDACKLLAERDWRRALDKLELLLVLASPAPGERERCSRAGSASFAVRICSLEFGFAAFLALQEYH